MRIFHSSSRPRLSIHDACVPSASATRDSHVRRRTRLGGWATLAAFVALAATFGAPSDAQAQVTVTVTSSGTPSVYGQPVTFTATVTPPEATGTVTFRDSLTGMCFNVPLSTGTCVKSNLIAGNHTAITARYNGDATYAAVTSAAISQLVHRASTTTGLTSDINPSGFGQNVKLTANVTPGATGRVTFTDNSTNPATPLGTATVNASGVAVLFFQYLVPGSHNLRACYPGNNNYEPSCSPEYPHVVNCAPTTTVLATPSPNPVACQQLTTLTATVSPSDATGSVEFTSNGELIFDPDPSVVNGVATVEYAPTSSGPLAIKATYQGNSYYCGSTSTQSGTDQTLTVNKAPSSVVVTVTPSPSFWGQTVTIRGTVQPLSATGTITFYDSLDAQPLGPAGSAPNATLIRANLPVRYRGRIYAKYSGDACFLPSTSAFVGHRVLSSATILSVTSSPNPSYFTQSVRITATILPIGPTGRVGFRDVSTNPPTELGTAALSSLTGLAILQNVTNLLPGHRMLQAYYASSQQDNNYMPSVSPAYDHFIEHLVSTTVLSSNTNPSLVGEAVDLIAFVTPTDGDSYRPQLGEAPPSVEFFEGAMSLGTADVGPGGAAVLPVPNSVHTDPFTEGTHSLTARYSGNFVYSVSTSLPFDQDVVTAQALRARAAALVTRLEAAPVELGVRVTWVANQSAFTKLELERGTSESGPWTALNVELREAAGVTAAEDRTAAAGQRYFYRVVGTTRSGTQAVFGPVEGTAGAPREFALSGAWPNPTRGALTMAISVPKGAPVRVSVLDLQGREVAVLADGGFPAGRHEVHWDGRTGGGQAAAGLYFIRCITPEKKFVSRVAIAR